MIRRHPVAADTRGVGMARYHAAEELHVAAFLDACFSVIHVLLNENFIYINMYLSEFLFFLN